MMLRPGSVCQKNSKKPQMELIWLFSPPNCLKRRLEFRWNSHSGITPLEYLIFYLLGHPTLISVRNGIFLLQDFLLKWFTLQAILSQRSKILLLCTQLIFCPVAAAAHLLMNMGG